MKTWLRSDGALVFIPHSATIGGHQSSFRLDEMRANRARTVFGYPVRTDWDTSGYARRVKP